LVSFVRLKSDIN